MTAKGSYQVLGPLSDEEYQALKADIAERGLLVPILVDSSEAGGIIDGHHRRRAIDELVSEGHDEGHLARNLPNMVQLFDGSDEEKRAVAWSLNMQRRHLDRSQKRELIGRKIKESPEWSNNRIAKLLGVSDTTMGTVRRGLEATSQIGKLEKTVGADGKKRNRLRWSTEEKELRDRLEAGETVVANKHRHENLVEWAEGEGLALDIQRPGKWGNPNKPKNGRWFENEDERYLSVWRYEHEHLPQNPELCAQIPTEVKGKLLVCGCVKKLCHGDVLAARADGLESPVSKAPEPEITDARTPREPSEARELSGATPTPKLKEEPKGAIEQLEEAGIAVPPPPSGRTHEEKVYEVLAHFRDTMRTMPSDPQKVARSIADRPLQVAATIDDFGELVRWLSEFHAGLMQVHEKQRREATLT